MALSDLDLVFIVCASAFTLAALAAFVIGQLRWRRTRRPSPAPMVVAACAAMAGLYWSMYFQFGFVLRTHDGFVVWWIRSAVHVLVVFLAGWNVGVSLWLSEEDGWFALLVGHVSGALAFLGAELSSARINYYWWGVGVGLEALTLLFTMRRARRQDIRARLLLWSSAVLTLGVPFIQLIGYTMIGWLEKPPYRLNTEIGYAAAYGAGVLIWGLASIVLYRVRASVVNVSLSQQQAGTANNNANATSGYAAPNMQLPPTHVKSTTPVRRNATQVRR